MLNSTMVDVAIGVVVIFLVSSLIASAVVEAIGGFLHRRQKHLWDSLDLLLGNTSIKQDEDASRVIRELYGKPFITGLVKPSDRAYFNPASGKKRKPQLKDLARVRSAGAPSHAPDDATKVPRRARKRGSKSRVQPKDLNRRFFGPAHIDPREFTSSLLSFIRPGGGADRALERVDQLLESVPETAAATDTIAIADEVIADLEKAGDAWDSDDIRGAAASLRAAGGAVDVATLQAAAAQIKAAIADLASGPVTPDEIAAGIGLLPDDLQEKLSEVLATARGSIDQSRKNIEGWFDRNMAAASEWYRRQTRWFLFAAGLVLAVSLNIDAAHATITLFKDPGTREALVIAGTTIEASECDDTEATDATKAQADEQPTPGRDRLDCVRETLGGEISLPVGWTDQLDVGFWDWGLRLVGWTLIAMGVTLGAPFWFDLLRRVLDYRKTHPGQSGSAGTGRG